MGLVYKSKVIQMYVMSGLLSMLNEIFLKESLQGLALTVWHIRLFCHFLSQNWSTNRSAVSLWTPRSENGTKTELLGIFIDSPLPSLINFESKCTKSSVNVWATTISKVCFKTILLNGCRRASNICSSHMYGVLWIHWCVANCMYYAKNKEIS